MKRLFILLALAFLGATHLQSAPVDMNRALTDKILKTNRRKQSGGLCSVDSECFLDNDGKCRFHGGSGFPPLLLLWPIDKGKGFDDLVLSQGSCYHKYMVDISYRRFEPLYEKAVQEVLDRCGAARVRDIKGAAERARFNKAIQEAVQEAVGL